MTLHFGKRWRGHPISYLALHSPDYCRWLLTVPRFKAWYPAEYAEVRRVVIEQLQREADIESLA